MAKKQARKLNRLKSFGTVFGGGEAAFEQDGILFDGAGIELPGFENVVIAEVKEELPADNRVVEDLIRRLQDDNQALRDKLAAQAGEQDEAMNLCEELQGKLDTANIEIQRLNAALSEATRDNAAPEVVGNKVKTNGGKSKGGNELDAQLALQAQGG